MQEEEGDEGWMAEGAAELDAQLEQREQEMASGSQGPGPVADAADLAERVKARLPPLLPAACNV